MHLALTAFWSQESEVHRGSQKAFSVFRQAQLVGITMADCATKGLPPRPNHTHPERLMMSSHAVPKHRRRVGFARRCFS